MESSLDQTSLDVVQTLFSLSPTFVTAVLGLLLTYAALTKTKLHLALTIPGTRLIYSLPTL